MASVTGNPVRNFLSQPRLIGEQKEAPADAGRGILVERMRRVAAPISLIAAKASTSTRAPVEAVLWVPSTVTLMVCAPAGKPLVDQTT